MSERVKDILAAVRTRLEAVGWPIISGRMVDAESDPIPCLTVEFSDGPAILVDESDQDRVPRRMTRQQLTLDVFGIIRVCDPSRALEELEDAHSKIHAALFDAEDRRMGLLLYDDFMLDSRHSSVPPSHVDLGVLQMTITLPYIEDY